MSAWLWLGLGGFCLSWASLLVKACTLPALSVAAWRLALGTCLLSLWPSARCSPNVSGRVLLVGGSLLAVHFGCWIASVQMLPVYLSVSLVTTSPLWVALGAYGWFGERTSPTGLVLAFLGGVLLSLQSLRLDGAVQPMGMLLALLGAWSMALYLLLARRFQSQAGQPGYALRVYAVSAGLLFLGAVAVGQPLGGFSGQQWGLLILLALVPQAMGHTLLLLAVRRGGANMAGLTILLEPVGSIALACWLLGERLHPWQGLGVLLTLTGLALLRPQNTQESCS